MMQETNEIWFWKWERFETHFFFHEAKGHSMTSQWQSREKAEKLWAFGKFQSRSKQPKNRIEIRVFSLKLGSQWLSQIFWFNSSLDSYKYSPILLTKTILNVLALFNLQYTLPLFHSEQINSSFTFLRKTKPSQWIPPSYSGLKTHFQSSPCFFIMIGDTTC